MSKIDIHNAGERDYHLEDGQTLTPGKTLAVESKLGEKLLAAYPTEIITPDSLRSGPSAQSVRDKSQEIARLRDEGKAKDELIAKLTEENQNFKDLLDEANAKIAKLTTSPSAQEPKKP